MKTTNTKSRSFVEKLQPFTANNLGARIEGNFYVVYSYNWYPLFAYDLTGNKWYENKDRYSVSTSKQTGQCRPYSETIKLSHEDLKNLIRG